jgi:hypothetical protein
MLLTKTMQVSDRQEGPYSYRVYGLCLRSHLPLACPQGSESRPADVELFNSPASLLSPLIQQHLRRPDEDDWFHCAVPDDGSAYLRWPKLGEFLISPDGRRIACHTFNGVSQETFQTYLVTQALSCSLVKQGTEPLHATVVLVNNEAVAFLGDCGYGKSSLGAAFLQAGHRLLTDDLLVVTLADSSGRRPLAHPGPARIKLFPEIAERLLSTRRAGVRMNPDTSKLIIPLAKGEHGRDSVPLKAVYVLKPPTGPCVGRHLSIRTMPLRRACIELIAGTFNLIVTDRARLKRQFAWAARLATQVPIKSLSYPRVLTQMSRVVSAICEDLAR